MQKLTLFENIEVINPRYLSAEMMISEFNNYLKVKHNLNGVSLQRFNKLITLYPQKIKCVGPRQRYEKSRIIPYIIECEKDDKNPKG